MSPRGRPLRQDRVRDLASGEGVVIVCGRFEGVDERVIAARGLEEVSIGDYVLSGGELAAMVLIDACVRLIPASWARRNRVGREFRAEPAGISAVYPSTGVGGAGYSRHSALRRPRQDRPLAARGGGAADSGETTGFAGRGVGLGGAWLSIGAHDAAKAGIHDRQTETLSRLSAFRSGGRLWPAVDAGLRRHDVFPSGLVAVDKPAPPVYRPHANSKQRSETLARKGRNGEKT